MDKRYNLYNLELEFKNFLIAGNVSPLTLKNYLSDIRHFFGWITSQSQENDIIANLTSENISRYKASLIENLLPENTVNRRLSTTRKFCTFCISQGWISENPAKKVINISGSPTQSGKVSSNSNKLLDLTLSSFAKKHPVEFENIQDYFEIINLPIHLGSK